MNPHLWGVLAATFLASAIEGVGVFTVVLAVGASVNWRSALVGAASAIAVLAVVIALLGTAVVRYVPVETLRLVVGALLVLFGLKWAKRSILSCGRLVAGRDEARVYERLLVDVRSRIPTPVGHLVAHGFRLTFKSTLSAGLEVAFIIVMFGAQTGAPPYGDGILVAAAGAVIAFVLVAVAGALVRSPLRGVPENTLTFVVGMLLTAFGTFWGGKGMGIHWWGGDLFLIALALFYGLLFGIMILWIRTQIEMSRGPTAPPAPRSVES